MVRTYLTHTRWGSISGEQNAENELWALPTLFCQKRGKHDRTRSALFIFLKSRRYFADADTPKGCTESGSCVSFSCQTDWQKVRKHMGATTVHPSQEDLGRFLLHVYYYMWIVQHDVLCFSHRQITTWRPPDDWRLTTDDWRPQVPVKKPGNRTRGMYCY